MNCKNCETKILPDQNFCAFCGAPVVTERLTLRRIWNNLVDQFFGWDNKYLTTLISLLLKPETVLKSYIEGTRKKYMAPFAFLAIGTAVAMIVFNQFSEEYMSVMNTINETQYDLIESQIDDKNEIAQIEIQKAKQAESNKTIQTNIIKYFNFFSFVMVPFFAIFTRIVFGKPFNYGEHLVITSYIQGFTFIFSLFIFLGSIVINPAIYFFSIVFSMLYYLYVYKRLCNYSLVQTILKLLKFFVVILVFTIVMGLVIIGVGKLMGL